MAALGTYLQEKPEAIDPVYIRTSLHNPWFTLENQKLAMQNLVCHFLNMDLLQDWMATYPQPNTSVSPLSVALIPAGNIPMVGFHDLLCILMSGQAAVIRCSDKDPYLLPFLADCLILVEPRFRDRIRFVSRLDSFDAVIATGSNNTARYFTQYFQGKPHIIRKNRQGVASLSGRETQNELMALGEDIFTYFGMGCRNVSKLFVPEGYDFLPLLDELHRFQEIIRHEGYRNNYDYQYAIWLLNKVSFQMTGSILMMEDKAIGSRIATLHYEYYRSPGDLVDLLSAHREEIQCVVSSMFLPGVDVVPFGKAQSPALGDYADGVDTMEFLLSLNSNNRR